MDSFLQEFLQFQRGVKDYCLAAGFWYDASDPRTGFALYGPQKARWNEVQAAHVLLKYPIIDVEDKCPMLRHPVFGEALLADYYHSCWSALSRTHNDSCYLYDCKTLQHKRRQSTISHALRQAFLRPGVWRSQIMGSQSQSLVSAPNILNEWNLLSCRDSLYRPYVMQDWTIAHIVLEINSPSQKVGVTVYLLIKASCLFLMWCDCAGTNIYLSSLLSNAPRTELESAVHSISSHLPTASIPSNTSHRHKIEETEEHLQDDLECRLSIGSQDKTRLSSDQTPISVLGGSNLWRDSTNDLMAGKVLHLEELSCKTGSGSLIVDRFCLELKSGASLLLQGKSGVGKSTLLKALQGLWPCTYSELSMCQEVFFHRKYTTLSVNTHLSIWLTWVIGTRSHSFDLWILLTLRKLVASVYPSGFCIGEACWNSDINCRNGAVTQVCHCAKHDLITLTLPHRRLLLDLCIVYASAVK